MGQLAAQQDIESAVGIGYISQLNSAGTIGNFVSSIAQQAINRLVFLDNPQLNQSLTQQNTPASIAEVIRQMKIQGASVLAMTVTATPNPFSTAITNVGNGVLNASVRRPFDGLVLENSFAENLLFTCTSSSYNGTAQAGNEAFTVTGTGSANVFDFNWPLGSNVRTSLQAINSAANNGQGNLLTNSGFAKFTGNVPNNFSIEVGTAGTQVFAENSITFGSPSALRLQGDGSTLTTLSQTFATSTGTTGKLNVQQQYSINLWLRRDGTAAGAGQLVVELTDGAGAPIKDVAGNTNSFTIDLTQLTTVYTAYNGVFRTPIALPSSYKVRLRMPAGNALSNGRSVYVDAMSLGSMLQLYTSGPFVAVHAGSTPFAVGDYSTCGISSSRNSNLDSFQVLTARLFPQMISQEFLLPSAGSGANTILDSLIS